MKVITCCNHGDQTGKVTEPLSQTETGHVDPQHPSKPVFSVWKTFTQKKNTPAHGLLQSWFTLRPRGPGEAWLYSFRAKICFFFLCSVRTSGERLQTASVCWGSARPRFVFVSGCEASGMSQARVTDFYSRTKKATGGPTKPAEPRSAFSCSSTVHEEFLRVIDEAAGLNHGAEQPLSSPRTPKRGSADLGATVSAAAVEHSTAKKRRQADLGAPAAAAGAEGQTRRSARKKLELPADTAQVTDVCVYTQTHRLCCPAFTL